MAMEDRTRNSSLESVCGKNGQVRRNFYCPVRCFMACSIDCGFYVVRPAAEA